MAKHILDSSVEICPLKELKAGEYFLEVYHITTKQADDLVPVANSNLYAKVRKVIWIKDYYDRSLKRYVCYSWNDINRTKAFKSAQTVTQSFTF